MFVLSHDYGELFRAAYLLAGHEFQSVFLMPERLLAVNRGGLPGPALAYRSFVDVCDAVDAERPDVVFLFSGYLYTINNLFHVDTVQALVRELRERECRLVTSDPFQGILADVDESTFDDAHPRKAWLTWLFRRLADIFRDVTHLDYIGSQTPGGPARVAFYNAHLVVPAGARAALRSRFARALPVHPAKPRWVFIMSHEDYATQVALHGRAAFDDLLLARLGDAAAAGRQAVLIAPRPCLDSLGPRAAGIEDTVALPAVAIDPFIALVTEAECVFYWNIFSNTTTIRVVNGQPFFAFDRGHMARSMPRLFEIAAARYQCGEPAYLDQTAPLDPDRLAALATVQEAAMRGPRRHFEQSPAPDAMLKMLRCGS